jgi:hypothetical protein
MEISDKYGRTYHYPFSPGVKNDDRINHEWQNICGHDSVFTEKLDGENTCISQFGLYARSHSAPTQNPWAKHLIPLWEQLKDKLGDLEIFGENLYAIHSIEYKNLDSHFYVFGIRDGGKKWLSWEDVKFWCGVLDLPVVPVLFEGKIETPEEHKKIVLSIANARGSFDPYDTITGKPTTIEGLVSRPSAEFLVEDFSTLVSKYVRKDHVSTDEHWTRNWKRAKLNFENASG